MLENQLSLSFHLITRIQYWICLLQVYQESFHQQITQVGFNEWLSKATEKEKNKLFKYYKGGNKRGHTNPNILFDRSCVSKSNTVAYDKESADKATVLIKEFVTDTLIN